MLKVTYKHGTWCCIILYNNIILYCELNFLFLFIFTPFSTINSLFLFVAFLLLLQQVVMAAAVAVVDLASEVVAAAVLLVVVPAEDLFLVLAAVQ